MIIMVINMMITMMTTKMAMVTMINMTVMMAMASFQVRIDYKGQRFVGENGKEISGLLVSIFSLFSSGRILSFQAFANFSSACIKSIPNMYDNKFRTRLVAESLG